MIMTHDKMFELGQKLIGKKNSQESVNQALTEMGFTKLPKITVPNRVHVAPSGDWTALTYNNMSIRLGVDANNTITDARKVF